MGSKGNSNNCCCGGCMDKTFSTDVDNLGDIARVAKYCAGCAPKKICVTYLCGAEDVTDPFFLTNDCDPPNDGSVYAGHMRLFDHDADVTIFFKVVGAACYLGIRSYVLGISGDEPEALLPVDDAVRCALFQQCDDCPGLKYQDYVEWSFPALTCSGGTGVRFRAARSFTASLVSVARCNDCPDPCDDPYAEAHYRFQEQVAVTADDGYFSADSGSTFNNNASTASVGNGLSTFLRFKNVLIPAGSRILSAHLTVQAATTIPAGELAVVGDAEANPAAVSSAANGRSRPRTLGSVAWDTGLPNGVSSVSPDLTLVVSELVAQAGWAKGNAMQLFLTSSSLSTYSIVADDGSHPAGAASLLVEYDPPPCTGCTCTCGAACIMVFRGQPFIDNEIVDFCKTTRTYTTSIGTQVAIVPNDVTGACELKLVDAGDDVMWYSQPANVAIQPSPINVGDCTSMSASWTFSDANLPPPFNMVQVYFTCVECSGDCNVVVTQCCDRPLPRLLNLSATDTTPCCGNLNSPMFVPPLGGASWETPDGLVYCSPGPGSFNAIKFKLSCLGSHQWSLRMENPQCATQVIVITQPVCEPLRLEFDVPMQGVACCGPPVAYSGVLHVVVQE